MHPASGDHSIRSFARSMLISKGGDCLKRVQSGKIVARGSLTLKLAAHCAKRAPSVLVSVFFFWAIRGYSDRTESRNLGTTFPRRFDDEAKAKLHAGDFAIDLLIGNALRDEAVDGSSAQIAGAAGQFGQRVLSASFLPFPLAPVREEGAMICHSERSPGMPVRPVAALRDRPREGAGSTRKRPFAESVGWVAEASDLPVWRCLEAR